MELLNAVSGRGGGGQVGKAGGEWHPPPPRGGTCAESPPPAAVPRGRWVSPPSPAGVPPRPKGSLKLVPT